MKCSRCGSEMKIKNIKVDTDIYGNPIYHKYAYCYSCKIKRNLGEQKVLAKPTHRSSSHRAKKRRKTKILITILLLLLFLVGISIFLLNKSFMQKKTENKTVANTVIVKNTISSDALEQLKTGMTYEEVKDLIRNEGNKLLEVDSNKIPAKRYQWATENGKGTVLLSFQDEKLISISKTDSSSVKFVDFTDKIKKEFKFDMTYNEIISLLGNEGSLLSESLQNGIISKLYIWKDSNSKQYFSAIFVEDKLQSYHFYDNQK